MDSKLDYIIEKIKNIKNINILELGVKRGISTKKFLDICENNNGFLTSIDIDDCSNVSNSDKWKFIHSSDDDFQKIDKIISKNFDFIFIDSLHEANHVQKVLYHYYNLLKVGGLCIIDDVSWIPYAKNEYRDNEFTENINRSIFKKLLEIHNSNKENFTLEFYFRESGYATINKKKNNILNQSKKIISRELGIKNLLRKFYKRMPKK